MNLTYVRAAIAAFGICVCPAVCVAMPEKSDVAEVRGAIQKELDVYAGAWKRLDSKAILEWGRAHLAPDWTQKELNGKVTKREPSLKGAEDQLHKPKPAGIKFTRFDVQIKQIRVNGGTANLALTETRDATYVDADGRFGPKGKIHRIGEVNTSNAIWVRSGSKWLVKREEMLSSKTFLDGKPKKIRL